MDVRENNIHERVLNVLYQGLKTDKHDKYLNKGLDKKYAVKDFYPDIILTNKDTEEVAFIVEIVTTTKVSEQTLDLWKPISDIGGAFYLLVPKESKSQIELQCRKHGIKVRVGTFELVKDGVQIKFN